MMQNITLKILSNLYSKYFGPAIFSIDNYQIIIMLEPILSKTSIEDIDSFFVLNGYIPNKIKQRKDTKKLFNQPVIFLLYYLSKKHPDTFFLFIEKQDNNLVPMDTMNIIYSDIGLSTEFL